MRFIVFHSQHFMGFVDLYFLSALDLLLIQNMLQHSGSWYLNGPYISWMINGSERRILDACSFIRYFISLFSSTCELTHLTLFFQKKTHLTLFFRLLYFFYFFSNVLSNLFWYFVFFPWLLVFYNHLVVSNLLSWYVCYQYLSLSV